MPPISDFRSYAFDAGRVDATGKNVGQKVYWKLYVIENLVRVILTAQVGALCANDDETPDRQEITVEGRKV